MKDERCQASWAEPAQEEDDFSVQVCTRFAPIREIATGTIQMTVRLSNAQTTSEKPITGSFVAAVVPKIKKTARLRNSPAATKIIEAVTTMPEIFRETRLKAKSSTEKAMTKFVISDVMEIPFTFGFIRPLLRPNFFKL
ncbi:hypothetical protein [Methanosarcina sp. WWM596]|uniref:hypothetical protein n=1 Tax=Methanosarcina sp. WWM596 TaxID=1434103 RepID=UPI00064FDA70|nr:hypothetical protein [Methanosarcina sp. WWM596]